MTVTARLTLVEAFKKTLNDGIKPRMCKHSFNRNMSYYLDFETSHLWMQHFLAFPYFSPSPEKQWQDPLPPNIPIWWYFEWHWQSLQQRLPDVFHGKSSCALTPKLHLPFYFWVFVFVCFPWYAHKPSPDVIYDTALGLTEKHWESSVDKGRNR